MIMLSGINNEHASESKYTYFMAGEKRQYVNHEVNMKYISILNYYTDGSSQWKMFLEIDAPKRTSKMIKKYKLMSSFFGYRTVKNLQF